MTVKPRSGERCARPWMSWMATLECSGSLVNAKVKSAAIGRPESCPCTAEARTVALHIAPAGSETEGVTVNRTGPSEVVVGIGPAVSQASENQSAAMVSGSLKVTRIVVSVGTPVALLGGAVEVTVGGPAAAQAVGATLVLRGFGAAAAKSAPLSPVSWHPPKARNAAVVLLSVGAAVPSK